MSGTLPAIVVRAPFAMATVRSAVAMSVKKSVRELCFICPTDVATEHLRNVLAKQQYDEITTPMNARSARRLEVRFLSFCCKRIVDAEKIHQFRLAKGLSELPNRLPSATSQAG